MIKLKPVSVFLLVLLIFCKTAHAQLSIGKAVVLGIPVPVDALAAEAVVANTVAYLVLDGEEKKRKRSVEELEKELRKSLKYYDATMELFRVSVNDNLRDLEDKHRSLTRENERIVLMNFGRSKNRKRLSLCRSLLDNIRRSNNFGIDDLVVVNGERVQAIFDLEHQLLKVKKMLDEIDDDMVRLDRFLRITPLAN